MPPPPPATNNATTSNQQCHRNATTTKTNTTKTPLLASRISAKRALHANAFGFARKTERARMRTRS
eukprot:7391041-Lingulodinium_polyedra.AAC.1